MACRDANWLGGSLALLNFPMGEELLWLFLCVANSNFLNEMGRISRQENYGGNCYVVTCLIWSSKRADLYAYAWFSWSHDGYFVEVKAMGATGSVLITSFLIRENILALITINIHASLTYVMNALGIYTVPSMNAIYAIFAILLMMNCAAFVFLLHILYAMLFTRLGMKASLTLPRWLEKAM